MDLDVDEIRLWMAAWIRKHPVLDADVITWAAPLVCRDQLRSPHRTLAQDPRWTASLMGVDASRADEVAAGFALFPFFAAQQERELTEASDNNWMVEPLLIDCCAAALSIGPSAIHPSEAPRFPLAQCDRYHCKCMWSADPALEP